MSLSRYSEYDDERFVVNSNQSVEDCPRCDFAALILSTVLLEIKISSTIIKLKAESDFIPNKNAQQRTSDRFVLSVLGSNCLLSNFCIVISSLDKSELRDVSLGCKLIQFGYHGVY